MPNPPAILVCTVGLTDVQLLLRGTDGALHRARLRDENVRGVHEALLAEACAVVGSSVVGGRSARGQEPEIGVRDGQVAVPDGFELARDGGRPMVVLPKLERIVAALLSNHAVTAALVLNTRRDPASLDGTLAKAALREPVMAGPVVARWLAERLPGLDFGEGLDAVGPGRAASLDYLVGEELWPNGDDLDNRPALARVDAALRRLRDSAGAGGSAKPVVCVSAAGGLPGLREAIKACVDFRFAGWKVLLWTDPEHRKAEWRAPPAAPGASESFRARTLAIALLRDGDFVGALAVARRFRDDARERPWVVRLRQAVAYLRGTLGAKKGLPPYLDQLVAPGQGRFAGARPPRCLLAALRVEAALRGKRWPEAIAGTVTFAETALLDAIGRQPWVAKLDDMAEEVTVAAGATPPERLTTEHKMKDRRANDAKGKDRVVRCLKETHGKVGKTFRYDLQGEARDFWLAELDAAELAEFFAKFRETSSDPGGSASPIRLRNLQVHAIIPAPFIDGAKKLFTALGLWVASEDTESFLEPPARDLVPAPDRMTGFAALAPLLPPLSLAGRVLKAEGVNDAAGLYRELVEGLCRDMEDHKVA